jgi:hypothetical protein
MSSLLQTVIDGTLMLKDLPFVQRHQLVGSACYHKEPKDVDFLVQVEPLDPLEEPSFPYRWAFGNGWAVPEGEYDDQDGRWYAMRKGDINLIITSDPAWYDRAVIANSVCHLLELQSKRDRVAVYRLLRDGQSIEQARASAKASIP